MTDLKKIIAAAQSKHGQPLHKTHDSTLLLSQIQPRTQDTRSLNQKHVESLAESISVLGLIEPLVVDQRGRLLAGGHRLAAISLLKETQAGIYQATFSGDRIPVRTLTFDAEADPSLALQIEVAENEQRRDYTSSEVRAIADRLRSAGYVDVKGRPKKGQQALMPALAVVVGKHLRTVQRLLNDGDNETTSGKSTTSVALLQQALTKLTKWQQITPKTKAERELAKKLPDLLHLIKDVLEE